MATIEQLKNAIKTKWNLIKTDMIRKTVTQSKHRLYQKRKVGLLNTTFASLYSL